jgi:hypothetical protein
MKLHVNSEIIEKLLTGKLTAEEEVSWYNHLTKEDCLVCDAFLESLDPEVEQALFKLVGKAESAQDMPAHDQKALLDQVSSKRRIKFRYVLVPAVGLAAMAAALLLVFIWADWMSSESPQNNQVEVIRHKGETKTAVFMDLMLGQVDHKKIRRLTEGQTIIAEGQVVFRLDTLAKGFLYLVRLGDENDIQVILPKDLAKPIEHSGGTYSPLIEGKPAGISLAKLSGRQSFVAFCAAKPISSSVELQKIVRDLIAKNKFDQLAEILSYNIISINVYSPEAEPR